MKDSPWQDIPPLSVWNNAVELYRVGKTKSKAGRRLKGSGLLRLKVQVELPPLIIKLTSQIEKYHRIKKASLERLPVRMATLRMIAKTGQQFIHRHQIPAKNLQLQVLGQTAYTKYKKSLDYMVGKVVRRALRKADYIGKLMQHIRRQDKGFVDKAGLLDYIVKKTDRPYDGDLAGMRSEVILTI